MVFHPEFCTQKEFNGFLKHAIVCREPGRHAMTISNLVGGRVLKRLVKGDGMRKSRLHNYKGELLDSAGFAYLPRCILTTLSYKLANHRPELPWLGFRAIKHLDRIINDSFTVLEFGSGMSTVWLARRCGQLVSLETNKIWYDKIRLRLAEKSLRNVDYRFSTEPLECVDDYDDSSFDLVLVDGYDRDRVMSMAIAKVKLGGYVYLDNSDVPDGEHQRARELLIHAAGGELRVRSFNDLYPTQISVNEGVLAVVVHKLS